MKMNKTVFLTLTLVLATIAGLLGAREASAKSSAPASRIVGVWLFRNQGTLIKATFTKAGRFTRIMRTEEGEETTQGKYSIASSKLLVRPDGGNELLRLNFRFVDNNQLELTDETGSGVRLVRQEALKPDESAADRARKTPPAKASNKATKAGANATKTSGTATAARPGKRPATIVFQRFTEPREKAFTALMPAGWKVDGGIIRLPPDVVGAHNATGAKGDVTLKRDSTGSLQMRWLPDLLYLDTRDKPYAGFTQVGGVFNDVIVLPKLGATGYLVRAVMPKIFPNAENVKVLSERKLPKLAQLYAVPLRTLPEPFRSSITCDAATITLSFEEGGRRFKARLVTVVQDFGSLGDGLWQGMGTSLYRAPADEFEAWLPVLGVIQGSVKWNLKWLTDELRSSAKRRDYVNATEAELRKMDAEIVKNHQAVNAEINKQMYLNLTSQEEYTNPFTKQVETGSNEWNRRWQNAGGDIIYTDDVNYHPNSDPNLHRQGFKLSPVRKR